MGTCGSVYADFNHLKPRWTLTVQFKKEFYSDKVSAFTKGFRPISNNTVELKKHEKNFIEGVRWSRGFKKGKHVVEFIYPKHLRAPGARVGLGTLDTCLGGTNLGSVVGGKGSYAVDLVSNKAIADNSVVRRLPISKPLPDWFFMYVDLDEGTIQFGSDTEFYGTAFAGVVVSGEPLFPIVTAAMKGAIIGIVYRGQGKEVFGPLRKKRTIENRKRVH